MSVPPSSRCVANECRSVCGVTLLVILALSTEGIMQQAQSFDELSFHSGWRSFGCCRRNRWLNLVHSRLCVYTSGKTLQTQSQVVTSAPKPVNKTAAFDT